MTYEALLEWFKGKNRFLILTHKRPDGDTLGCAAGLCAILRQLGHISYVLDNPEATETYYGYIAPYIAPGDFTPDYVIAVDTAGTALIPLSSKPWLERGIDLAIDHHSSHVQYASEYYVNKNAAACGEIITQLALDFQVLTPAIAQPLYVAISTDTGCFRYSSTTSKTLRYAAELMDQGIDYVNLNRIHFQTKSVRRLKLEGLLIDRIHLYDGGRLAITALTQQMLLETGATDADSEDVAPIISSLEGALATITLKETEEGFCKISVRTNGMNASSICAQIGGGGHPAAAGGFLRLGVDEAEVRMVEAYFQEAKR